jgi:hypothetical protein
MFKWHDFGVGVYWDKKEKYLYIILIPTIVIRIKFYG